MDHTRLALLEGQVRELSTRVALLERPAFAEGAWPERRALPEQRQPRAQVAVAAGSVHAEDSEPSPTLRERVGLASDAQLEDLLGGRVLAWVGGLAVFLGLLFLLAIAISRGWLGEGARTALAALASAGLVAAGAWLHERSARPDAARAAAAAGLAGLFATLTVATRVYGLVPGWAGFLLALLVGGGATALAIRWNSRGIAALGILGAVAAPLLVDAGHAPGTLALLFAALAAATGVLLWRRWDWLALAAFALAAPQWISYLFDGASVFSAAVALVAFGGLGVAMAVGH